MISQFYYRLRRISRKLWVRAALISLLAILAAVLAPLLTPLIPEGVLAKIKPETVRSILDILANSLLAVTTFSLTVMVTAHLNASQQVTPRSHRLLRQDGRTQGVLATFIGAFVYSLTAIVMLQLDLISERGHAVLYFFTLAVLALVILSILRWIDHLASLGSVEDTTDKVQNAAAEALRNRMSYPFLGGRPMPITGGFLERGSDVVAPCSNYINHIDTERLSRRVGQMGGQIYLTAVPGDWVGEGDRIAVVSLDALDEEAERKLRDCYSFGARRNFTQDVLFGVMSLSEIAERALSPSMNDPHTATDVVARLVLLFENLDAEQPQDEPAAPNVFAPPFDIYRLVEKGYYSIARDGAGFLEVQLHVQIALARLARHRNPQVVEAARIVSGKALAFAEMSLPLESDRARVREVALVDAPASHDPRRA